MFDDRLAGIDTGPGQIIGTWRGTTMGRLVRYCLVGAGLLALAASAASGSSGRLDGFNVVATPDHPFGSASAGTALAQAKQLGANAVAIIPFLWQANPASPNIVRGSDMPDEMLRAAIRQARSAGIDVVGRAADPDRGLHGKDR
jgi:hypothetical protein